ncbi:MAG: DNA polymerase III subunit gamma/tau, partial [Sandaracinaceae bacterium]|nr:DNA polymerase III subunit gamma/tau [Sandaracinaceae bacterium]
MSYLVLARKYRPQRFDDLVGQDHVARTLSNAIASGRVAHAFLFTGARGVGKTTTARLLARALNCEEGPTPEPCGRCFPCVEIAKGTDMDVLEIDGASNNSVDDVRRLQELIPFQPARDRYRIIIIDEVHMLSQGAFNALLKTLEEPPPHVKFIFATTEVHKVPITIRSRCQRYDFRLIPQRVIVERLKHILRMEGIDADEAALGLIAREAAGSMRDALTLMDQVVAFTEGKVRGEEVEQMLGIARRELLKNFARALIEGHPATVLHELEGVLRGGADLVHTTRSLADYLRDLVVLSLCGKNTHLVEMPSDEKDWAHEWVQTVEQLEIQRAFQGVAGLVDEVARSPVPRATLEMGLVRLASRPRLHSIAELIDRVKNWERRWITMGGNPESKEVSQLTTPLHAQFSN